MLKKYAEQYARQIVGLLGVLPSDMLLLLKTNDCLRHLDTQLGTPINSTEGISRDSITFFNSTATLTIPLKIMAVLSNSIHLDESGGKCRR